MKLLVTGARGLLGSEIGALAHARSLPVSALGRDEMDVRRADVVRDVVSSIQPDVVIQCAAFTRVDAAEADPDGAMELNRDATRNVAAAAERIGARFVYVSTDYVFDGARTSPYPTDASTGPLSVYGRTKLAGEVVSREVATRVLVVRTSWLFGAARPNFVTSMIERAEEEQPLTVVDDQIGGPSWARNVAESLLDLVELDVHGTVHVADRGGCSRAELAREAVRLRGLDAPINGVAAEVWGAAAPRPRYSVLDVSATEKVLGRRMPDWRDSLSRFLARPAPTGRSS